MFILHLKNKYPKKISVNQILRVLYKKQARADLPACLCLSIISS
jgi:hypothetical protein